LARHNEPVVVIGLGRFGSALALELARRGTDVLAIDSHQPIVQRLAGQLSQVVTADATDIDALRGLGVGDFRRAVVAIGTDQQASILATATLSDLGVEDIWAKALDAQHARILERVGAHHVVQPEHEMGERVAHLVSGRMLDWVEVDAGWVLAKTRPPKFLASIPLGESKLRAKHKVTVVAVKPQNGTAFTHAGTDTVLTYGDQIVIGGHPDDVEKFVELL
jgi:trk system potassium uptake protein